MMNKENIQKPVSAQTHGSIFPSMTHPSSSFSQNKEDLFRRLRSGKDILCTLPARLDPNIQFSEDEDSEEIKEKAEEMKAPQTLPSFKMRQLSMHQTPLIVPRCRATSSCSPVLDDRKIFPSSAAKNRSFDLNHSADRSRINSMSKPEISKPLPQLKPYELQPSNSVSNLPKETIVVNDKPYRILSFLGSGGSCKVYSVYDSDQKSVVAVKCVDLKNADKEIRKGYKKEIEYLKLLQNSKSVIRMFDYQYSEHELLIVLEKGEIDLAKYLSNEVQKRTLTPLKVKFYWAQMLEAVSDIHRLGIVHSDLKPANFLLVEGCLKLIDFGIASLVPDDMTSAVRDTYIGTLNYMSPEAVTQTSSSKACFKVSVKSDVWSLGCILYNLVYGKTPFQSIRNVVGKIRAITDPSHEIEFKEIPDRKLLDVLKKCLQRDPKERASVDELLQHPYLMDKDAKASSSNKGLEDVLQQMQGLTPRRMSYVSRVVQMLSNGHTQE